MNSSNSIGQNIFTARKSAGLKQKELAEKLGLTPTALNYYEKGKRMPSIEILKQISSILNVGMDYLLGLESQEAQPLKDALATGNHTEAQQQLGLPEGSLFPAGGVMMLDSGEAVPYISRASAASTSGLSYDDLSMLICRHKSKSPSPTRLNSMAQLLRLASGANDQELEKLLGLAQVLLNEKS